VASYVVDLTHFLDDSGRLAPGHPGRVGAFYARIAATASLHPCEEVVLTPIPCRRRPGRRPCPGHVDLIRHDDDTIEWACTDCTDNGFIRGWEATRWDRRQAAAAAPPDEVVDLLLSQDEFAEIRRLETLGPNGQILIDGAVRVGGGVRMRGARAAFAGLVADLASGADRGRSARRQTLRTIAERLAEIAGGRG
jgi:hypothetical protein